MKKTLRDMKNIFATGLIVLFPLAITIFIIVWLFNFTDSFLGNFFYTLFSIDIPGLGLLATILLIFIIGLFTSNVLGKKIFKYLENMILKIPIIKTIYSPSKDIIKNFSGNQNTSFRKVVLVEFPSQDMYSIGFVTKESLKIKETLMQAIFIPTTPNPTNGFLIYTEKQKYSDLNISVDEAIKTIISLGSISPNNFI